MHFSLRGMQREGDLEKEDGGGDQFRVASDQGAHLNSCPSFQIRGAWVFHDSVVRTGENGWSGASQRGMQHLGCLLVFVSK